MQIKIISNTAASGVVFSRGMILSTPDDLSESDAKTLILHRRAIVIAEPLPIKTIGEDVKSEEKKPKRRIKK